MNPVHLQIPLIPDLVNIIEEYYNSMEDSLQRLADEFLEQTGFHLLSNRKISSSVLSQEIINDDKLNPDIIQEIVQELPSIFWPAPVWNNVLYLQSYTYIYKHRNYDINTHFIAAVLLLGYLVTYYEQTWKIKMDIYPDEEFCKLVADYRIN